MLVLTRKYQEKIRIGDGITITILRTKGKAVRLGIEAPVDVPVLRGELVFEPASDKGKTLEIEALSPNAVADSETDSDVKRTSDPSRRLRVVAEWNTQSHPHPTDRRRESNPSGKVTLRRVPRDKAVEILPQLLSGHGPLRDMLNQRSHS